MTLLSNHLAYKEHLNVNCKGVFIFTHKDVRDLVIRVGMHFLLVDRLSSTELNREWTNDSIIESFSL